MEEPGFFEESNALASIKSDAAPFAPSELSGAHTGGSVAAAAALSASSESSSIKMGEEILTRDYILANPALLRELKAEKKKLQVSLRTFEKEFEEREKRKVKFVKDIAPIAHDYARYKDIKSILRDGKE